MSMQSVNHWSVWGIIVSMCAACAPIDRKSTMDVNQTSAVSQSVHPLMSKVGQKVALFGIYAGWAACPSSMQRTRSDWVLTYQDGGVEQCVFVSGGVPQGITPPPAKTSVGLPVNIQGVVTLSDSGRPFIRLD